MTTWFNLASPGKCRRYVQIVADDSAVDAPLTMAAAACAALWPVVQPLSATLELAARTRELPFLERGVPVPAETWHLRELVLPGHVPVAARVQGEGHREDVTRRLTPDVMAAWLANACAQQLDEGYVATLYNLELHYTRARVLAATGPTATLTYGPESYAVPVEERDDGRWVAGPLRGTMTNPPLKVELGNLDGRLMLSVCAGWSPWAEAGAPEAALLAGCLDELLRLGWAPDTL